MPLNSYDKGEKGREERAKGENRSGNAKKVEEAQLGDIIIYQCILP